jgi:photosystem II stability/assembly factor-like uncharacterized protein
MGGPRIRRTGARAAVAAAILLGLAPALLGGSPASATTSPPGSWSIRDSLPAAGLFLDNISCPTTDDCFAVGEDSGADIAVITTDGGDTWVTRSLPAATGVPGEKDYLDGVACPTATECVAVGVATDPHGVILGGDVVTTGDGGSTWAFQSLPSGVGGLDAVACPSPTDCYASGDDAGDVAVIATTDGGSTWVSDDLPDMMAGLDTISCPSTTDCVAAGESFAEGSDGGGFDLFTTDGGVSWSTTPLAPRMAKTMADLSCPSTSDCFAVGGNSRDRVDVVESTDGGSSWKVRGVPKKLDFLGAVACPSTSECVASGEVLNNAVTVATTNTGRSWSVRSLPTGVETPLSISCPGPASCFATSETSTDVVILGSSNPAHRRTSSRPSTSSPA